MELKDFAKKLLELAATNPSVDKDGFIPSEDVPEELAQATDNLLITPKGNPNYCAFVHLEDFGIEVGPGETDRFGWVTGVINIPGKFKILF